MHEKSHLDFLFGIDRSLRRIIRCWWKVRPCWRNSYRALKHDLTNCTIWRNTTSC